MTEDLSYSEKFIDSIKKAYARYKVPFLSALIVGFLTYGFALTNKLVNLDDASAMFGKGALLESGRWALKYTSWIFPDYSMPWIYGIIGIVLVAVSVCLIIEFLGIKNKLLQALFAGLTLASPALICTSAFMFTFPSYCLAILLASLAAYTASKAKLKYKVLGVLLSVLSMGIYQPYIALTASLFLIKLLKELVLDGKSPKSVIKNGLSYLLCLAFACGIYLGITLLLQRLNHSGFGGYARSAFHEDISVFSKIKRCYTVLFSMLLSGEYGILSTPLARALHVLCAGAVAGIIVKWAFICKDVKKILLALFVLCLLPIGINAMFLVTYYKVRPWMLFSYTAIYALICVAVDGIGQITDKARVRAVVFDLAALAMSIIVLCNIYLANGSMLRSYLAYENAESFYTSLITRIECQPGFDEDSRIALIGEADEKIYDFPEFDGMVRLWGAQGISVNEYSREDFIRHYIGFDPDFTTYKENKAITETEAFKSMPVYPYEGSVAEIDGYIVVKLGKVS